MDKNVGFSIFAKKPYRIKGDGHLGRVSSIIRGTQISERLGAKLNPESGFENDICIYVKPHVKPGMDFNFQGKPFLDIIDSTDLYPLATMHPEVPVIAISKWDFDVMSRRLPNKIIFIPQHHCNFDREVRTRTEVTTVGVIGTAGAFGHLPEELDNELERRGLNIIKFSGFTKREEIVDFYKSIDIQIVWRPYFNYKKDVLMNPLKLVNAASFGIPTVAYKEPVFNEIGNAYVAVRSLEQLLECVDNLRTMPDLYRKYSDRCLKLSESYHIDKVVDMYRSLCTI